MKNLFYFVISVSLLMISCGEENFKEGNVVVTLKVDGTSEGKAVIEKLPVAPKTIVLDTVDINQNGEATFNIDENEIGFYSVFVLGQKGQIRFLAEAGDSIHLSANSASISASAKVSGTAENERLDSLSSFLIGSSLYQDSIKKVYADAQAKQMHYVIHDETVKLMNNAMRKETTYILNYIDKNPDQISNIIALVSLDRKYFRSTFKKVETNLLAKYPNSEYVQNLKIKNDKFFPPGLGEQAPEFSLMNQKDELIKLKDYKGKYVLLDFWATWCKPCIQEIPHINNAFQKIDSEKLEIISICVDKNTEVQKALWKKIIEKHDAQWTQVYEGSEGTLRNYKIQGFPTLILINPEGVIIERGPSLRGPNNINVISKYMSDAK